MDVFSKEIYPAEISIREKRIKSIRKIDKHLKVYILPGLIDSHIHIESSMVTPAEFAKIAVQYGTVAVVADPHEIANVSGVEGIDFMIENGRMAPLKFFFGAPSCVPATEFETSGAVIDSKRIKKLLERDDIYFLSEMMNFPGVINKDPDILRKISFAHQFHKPIDGHAPGLLGEPLKQYVSNGITTDHECLDFNEAEEKIAAGMKIQIREGSAAKGFDKFSNLIDIYPDSVMLCSDDIHPEDLIKAHINKLLARGVQKGLNVFNLVRSASVNPVNHYKLPVGLLREGDFADLIIVNNIREFDVLETYIDGEKVYGDEGAVIKKSGAGFSIKFRSNPINREELKVEALPGGMRVIKAIDGDLFTGSLTTDPKIMDGYAVADIDRDILKIVIVNKYLVQKPVMGFISGFGLKKGAIAGSIAHDSHNIIAVGVDDHDIVTAINGVIKMHGGLSVASSEEYHGLQLEIGGLMTDRDVQKVAEEFKHLEKQAKSFGCKLKAPFMTLSFMALLVIPELKISDKGLFDVNKFSHTSLFLRDNN